MAKQNLTVTIVDTYNSDGTLIDTKIIDYEKGSITTSDN